MTSWRPLAALAALAVAACSVEPVTAIKPFSSEGLRGASVSTITMVNQSATATTENLASLQNELANHAARCATGPARYDMIVQVQEYRGDLGLLAATYAVTARVVLVDPVANVVVGTYHVGADRPGEFAQRVCRNVFGN